MTGVVHAVHTDRWDREDWAIALDDMAVFRAARERLVTFTATGGELFDDAFQLFLQADPFLFDAEDMVPSHLVNRTIIEAFSRLPDTHRLRQDTVGDVVGSALACVELERDMRTVFDRFETQQTQANQAAQAAQVLDQARDDGQAADDELDEFMARWVPEDPSEALDGAANRSASQLRRIAELEALFDEMTEQLDQSLQTGMVRAKQSLRDALQALQGRRADFDQVAAAWGVEPGELRRIPMRQRIELAARLSQPRVREIAELFGRLHHDVATRTTPDQNLEISGLEFGDRLERLIPAELLLLCDPAGEWEFLRRYSEEELVQYAMDAETTAGRGGIVLCVDGTGSMAGEPDIWAKAIMLKLLRVAEEQGRAMHVLVFGSVGEVHVMRFVDPDDFRFDRILEASELAWGGGTSFVTPMQTALQLLEREHARAGTVQADVVFVTDGICWVENDDLAAYLAAMKAMEATTYGILVQQDDLGSDSLTKMTEGKVALVRDFASTTAVRDLFAAIENRGVGQ